MANFENHPLHPGEATPLFIAAGVLKTPAEIEPFTHIEDPLAAPLLYFGGYTTTPWAGNAKPGQQDFVYYPERRMAGNARGLPNDGIEGIRALKEPIRILNEIGIKTIIQVTNLPSETAVDVVPRLAYEAAEQNPTAVEVNLGCPNGLDKDGNLEPPLANNAEASAELMAASREEAGKDVCLGIKDSPHVTSLEDAVDEVAIYQLIAGVGDNIDFVCGINTIGDQPFPEIECAGGKGGMSGPVVAPTAREHILIWERDAPNIPYLSTGGMDSRNAEIEVPARLAKPNVIRVGGAQEFYRAKDRVQLAANWAIAAA